MPHRLITVSVFTLLCLSGCATITAPKKADLPSVIHEADTAYRGLPAALPAYNAALRELAEHLENSGPAEFAAKLTHLGVELDLPDTGLPLKLVEIPDQPADATSLGVSIVLGYDTADAPLYPPEGLFVDAAAVYQRVNGKSRLSLIDEPSTIKVDGQSLPVAFDPTKASHNLEARARPFAATGFHGMIRPESMTRKPQIYLLEPYDPRKTPILMVHGLQSTPVAFATLLNALHSDLTIRRNYQIWQFYYPSGNPVLANATSLRDSLNETLAKLDPTGHAPASQRIVVIGHSMGGVISQTLASSSGDKVWSSVFTVPPEQIKGDPAAIEKLKRNLFFERDRRIGRLILMAAPLRGSPMADSIIGRLGNSLTRLATTEESDYPGFARDNAAVMVPGAAKFYAGGRFSSVRTLSGRSTALIAVSNLPIPIPFHTIIGQQRSGPKERGSDGVVPYWSSHRDGAESELVVRSGHNVISNPEAIAEVIRILHEDPAATRINRKKTP